ncbi:MAG: DUF2169 domain-containing protein [Reinekea sp.]
MQLDNYTDWAAALEPGWSAQRQMQMTCTIKTGFKWQDDGTLQALTADECPLIYHDEYSDDDAELGVVIQSRDVVPFKQGFEWLLNGSVYPRPGAKTQSLQVTFNHAGKDISKTIYAIGPRHWKKTLLGMVVSKAEPLQPGPITYQQAFGGQLINAKDKIKQYDPNPVGVGFYALADKDRPVPLPKFEYAPLIRTTKDQPKPAGFGAFSMSWAPRAEKFQALDNNDAGEEGQCPYPISFAEDLYNCAPLDQRLAEPPQPGTRLLLRGFAAEYWEIDLPDIAQQIKLRLVTGKQVSLLKPVCDTLLIDTDKKQIAFVWRVGIPWHPLKKVEQQVMLDAMEIVDNDG